MMKKGHGRWPKIANRGHFVALLGAKNGTGHFILVIDANVLAMLQKAFY